MIFDVLGYEYKSGFFCPVQKILQCTVPGLRKLKKKSIEKMDACIIAFSLVRKYSTYSLSDERIHAQYLSE